MADNLGVATGTDANIATDEVSGVHFPVSKLAHGNSGENDGLVSSTNPLPVAVSGVATAANQVATGAVLDDILTAVEATASAGASDAGLASIFARQGDGSQHTIVDSGTVTANLGTIGGAATEASLAALNAKVTAVNTGAVVVSTLPATPAGTNLIGKVVASQDVDTLYAGTTALTVKYANIDCASSGNNELVAAVSGKVLKVISVAIFASGAVDAVFNDGTANLLGGTRKIKLDNTGAVGAGGLVLQSNPTGWFKTAGTNRPINLNLSAGVGVAGCLAYVEE